VNSSKVNRRLSYIAQIRLAQIDISARTIYRAFKQEGYIRYIAKKKYILILEQKEKRLQFAIAFLFLTVNDWAHIL
jgi:hypothetical protein